MTGIVLPARRSGRDAARRASERGPTAARWGGYRNGGEGLGRWVRDGTGLGERAPARRRGEPLGAGPRRDRGRRSVRDPEDRRRPAVRHEATRPATGPLPDRPRASGG